MVYILSVLIGYLFGCVHGSQIIGNLKKVDIKNSGVKNAGASNTTIVLGWKYGIIVAIIDILKGIVPIVLLRLFIDDSVAIVLAGAMAIIGHNYPMTMRFQGGKGTATMIGMVLALDWKIGLFGIGLLVFFTLMTDYLVVGVMVMYTTWVSLSYLWDYGYIATGVALALSLLSVLKHRENFKRMKEKTEPTLSSALKKKKKK